MRPMGVHDVGRAREIPASLYDFLDSNSFFYVLGHVSPDGDSVGSCLAFAVFLEKIGKRCAIIAESKKDFMQFKAKIDFCAGKAARDVPVSESMDLELVSSGRASCVFLDCSGIERTGDVILPLRSRPGVIDTIRNGSARIDHHPGGTANELCYVDSSASSASELVAEVIEERIGLDDAYICNALFFGIASDTGFFRFSTVSNASGTFRMCSKLICAGVSPNIVSAALDSGKDKEYVAYCVALAKRAEYLCGGKAVLITDDKESYEKYTKAKRPSDDLYRLFQKVGGVEAVVFVKYSEKEGYVDASVRVSALSDFDANVFCGKFGGGGHVKASGFHASGDFDAVCAEVRSELERCF